MVWGGDGVWCDEERVLSADHPCDTVQVWRTWMIQFGDPMGECYQIANDKSPASLRGSVKKTQFKIMKTIVVIRMGLEPMTLTLKV